MSTCKDPEKPVERAAASLLVTVLSSAWFAAMSLLWVSLHVLYHAENTHGNTLVQDIAWRGRGDNALYLEQEASSVPSPVVLQKEWHQ